MLRQLADGEFHSGARLAQALRVSRASVWNALNEACAAGLEVQRVHGRGYRLREPLDWLDAPGLGGALAPHGLAVRVVERCESTNADLLREAEAGVSGPRVLAAEMQTRGRGRLGRMWHSGIASALTFSLLWRFERPVAGLAGLSLAVGVAIARALRMQGVCAQLKWPNDLLWDGRKLGGILIEVRGDALGPCAAVIGVGLNVRLGAAQRQQIDQPAADLHEASPQPRSRTEWLIHVLGELARVLPEFEAQGFAAVREEWMRYHAHQGATVRLAMPDGASLEGTALGVDETASLLVATDWGIERVHTGDVSLRARP